MGACGTKTGDKNGGLSTGGRKAGLVCSSAGVGPYPWAEAAVILLSDPVTS